MPYRGLVRADPCVVRDPDGLYLDCGGDLYYDNTLEEGPYQVYENRWPFAGDCWVSLDIDRPHSFDRFTHRDLMRVMKRVNETGVPETFTLQVTFDDPTRVQEFRVFVAMQQEEIVRFEDNTEPEFEHPFLCAGVVARCRYHDCRLIELPRDLADVEPTIKLRDSTIIGRKSVRVYDTSYWGWRTTYYVDVGEDGRVSIEQALRFLSPDDPIYILIGGEKDDSIVAKILFKIV